MTAFVLAAVAFAGDEPRDALASTGETLPGAVVERVETHPEYHRYWLRYADGGALVPAEVTLSREGHTGQCEAHGATLYARVELAEGSPPKDVLAPVRTLCERLAGGAPAFDGPAAARGPRPEGAEEVPRARVYPLHAAVVAWLTAGILAIAGPGRRAFAALATAERRELAAVLLVSIVARLGSPVGIFNGGGGAWEKLVLAWGADDAPPYGQGWPALMGPVLEAFGRHPDVVFATVRVWAIAAPPLLWVVARSVAGAHARVAALASGLALALLPIHLGVSASEAMHVPVLTLELVAMAAALGGAPVLAALSAGLAAHVRPEALAFAAVPAAVLLAGRRWGGLAVLAGLVAARLAGVSQPQQVLRPEVFLDPSFWLELLMPRLGPAEAELTFSVFLHAAFTPPVLWALALAGIALASGRLRALLLLWWACTELPVAAKVFPLTDAWRLQLVSQPVWLLLVGVGVGGLATVLPRGGTLPAWGLGALLALAPPAPVWAHRREYTLLARVVPRLSAGDRVIFEDAASRASKFGRVMGTMGPATWAPATPWLDGDGTGVTHVWLGLGCAGEGAAICERIRRRCALAPVEEATIGTPADLDLPLPAGGAKVGLYRVTSCGS